MYTHTYMHTYMCVWGEERGGNQGDHESEKYVFIFLLKTFQRKSSTVKIFCSNTHLKIFC